jgi:hypothetical protein
MTAQQNWALKGVLHECCRREGHCSLWFGRELWEEPCTSLATFEIKEGQIENIDMSGIIIILCGDGIGPTFADIAKGIELAVYISDNATDEQRRVLEPFASSRFCFLANWREFLGVKFVKINIAEENGTYHITMPYGEVKMSLTVGGDGKNPIRMENPQDKDCTNVRFCNTQFWKYHDYGKNLEFHNTSGIIADYAIKGGRPMPNGPAGA